MSFSKHAIERPVATTLLTIALLLAGFLAFLKLPVSQAGINAARAYLPSDSPSNPCYYKVNPADSPVLILAMTSDALTQD